MLNIDPGSRNSDSTPPEMNSETPETDSASQKIDSPFPETGSGSFGLRM